MKGGVAVVLLVMVLIAGVAVAQESSKGDGEKKPAEVSFKNDVMPIVNKYCMPCHAEDNFNPSELSLDSYKLLMEGGKKGASVLPGKSAESIFITKLSSKPPFGDRMPLNSKKAIKDGKAKFLSDEEVKVIATWIDQGAKNN